MRKFWPLLFGVVLAGAFILTAISPMMGWWIPRNVASYGGEIDMLFYVILGVTAFFFVLTEAILVVNMYKYEAEPGRKAEFTHGHHRLEMIWTIVPGVLLFLLAVVQINVWAQIKYPSHLIDQFETGKGEEYLQMEVTTRQWEFRMRYPSPDRLEGWKDKAKAKADFEQRLPPQRDDVYTVNDVHTWKNQKVIVYLKTRDVNHAFFVPVLRVKQDALPGRTIPLWFEAMESNVKRSSDQWVDGNGTGDPEFVWDLVCTHYCGSRHSLMRGKLYVHPTKEDFVAWLKNEQKNSLRTEPEKAAEKVAAVN
jgi:cytochrome c oxidase subunit 2